MRIARYWWKSVEDCIKNYEQNKKSLENLYEMIAYKSKENQVGSSSSVSNPTQSKFFEIEKDVEIYKAKIAAIKLANEIIRNHPKTNEIHTIIKLCVKENTHTMTGASMVIGCCPDEAGRLRTKYYILVAHCMREILSEKDKGTLINFLKNFKG